MAEPRLVVVYGTQVPGRRFASASIVPMAQHGGASVWRDPPPASTQPEGRPCAAELTTQNRRSNEMISNFRVQNARLRGRAGLSLPSTPPGRRYHPSNMCANLAVCRRLSERRVSAPTATRSRRTERSSAGKSAVVRVPITVGIGRTTVESAGR